MGIDSVSGIERPKEQQFRRCFVILVTGILATGKSVLAERLSVDLSGTNVGV